MQPTHTNAGVDLAGIALRCGFPQATTVRRADELDSAVSSLYSGDGPVLVVLKVSSARDPLVLPPWDGALLKSRFRQAVLGAAGRLKVEPHAPTFTRAPSWFLRSSSSMHRHIKCRRGSPLEQVGQILPQCIAQKGPASRGALSVDPVFHPNDTAIRSCRTR